MQEKDHALLEALSVEATFEPVCLYTTSTGATGLNAIAVGQSHVSSRKCDSSLPSNLHMLQLNSIMEGLQFMRLHAHHRFIT